jgi:hypothetical protein
MAKVNFQSTDGDISVKGLEGELDFTPATGSLI